jgi:hypothetical protein
MLADESCAGEYAIRTKLRMKGRGCLITHLPEFGKVYGALKSKSITVDSDLRRAHK